MKKFISLLLVCLMVVPFGMLAGVSVSADSAKTVYLSDAGDDTNDGATAANAVKTITKAYTLLGANGGTIVVSGTFTQSADFIAPDHTGKITVKGADASAVYSVSGKRYQSGGPLEFANIKINQTAANFMVVGNFHELTIASTVVHERGTYASFILAGAQGGDTARDRDCVVKDTTLNVYGGDWSECVGAIRTNLKAPSGAHTADEYKNLDLTINVGGTAVIGKIAAFSRGYGACDVFAENASCTINLEGGKVTYWIGMHDISSTVTAGYEKGLIINIGKDFDFNSCFGADAAKQENNIVSDTSGNQIFYGINGDNVFVVHSNGNTLAKLGKSKVVIAAEIYDSIKNSDRFRDVTVEKAAVSGGNQGGNNDQGNNQGSNPDTGDMTWAVAAVAAVAVMGGAVAVVAKKREN